MSRMTWVMVAVAGLAGALVLAGLVWPSRVRGEDRVKAAREKKGEVVKKLVAAAGLSYPVHQALIRIFKQEAQLEVWGRDRPDAKYIRIASYPICSSAGRLGPKRRQGDGQVPEGVYQIDVFNAQSRFHLSLGLNYPNRSDQILGDPQDPGDEIFIHGGCVTIGCVPIQDGPIEEVYLLALDGKTKSGVKPVVLIFPCRFNEEKCRAGLAPLRQNDKGLDRFWTELEAIHAAFEKNQTLPAINIDEQGRYVIRQE